ncbi:MAG: YdcF family protein, partial [Parvularcula sp.]|nr:YdcF family protein [Parvularcula sp.]
GFFVFCAMIPRAGELPAEAIAAYPRAERGLVVLTGDGGQRIAHALELQQAGIADRLLISGVHPKTSLADLAPMGNDAVLACCVDLGPLARTTRGNAVEARAWLRSHDYKVALIVTSDFHMPRAVAELRRTAPEVEVIGIPVESRLAPAQGWMSDPGSWKLLVTEYLKFLVVKARSFF